MAPTVKQRATPQRIASSTRPRCCPAGRQLADRLRPADVVVLHGAETAGLAEAVREAGAHPVWRCHVGTDAANASTRRAWEFLDPYVRVAEATVFSRRQFIWESVDPSRAFVIAPALNPLSPRNETLNPSVVEAILKTTGLEQDGSHGDTAFVRLDGQPAGSTGARASPRLSRFRTTPASSSKSRTGTGSRTRPESSTSSPDSSLRTATRTWSSRGLKPTL